MTGKESGGAFSLSWRKRPIGIFDSGVGGLTVLKALRRKLPSESFVYFGDTARVPYGTKSPATVRRYAAELSRFLMSQRVKLLVVACNTVSSTALSQVKAEVRHETHPVPVVDVIGPGVFAALAATRNHRIGILGTAATIRSGAYSKNLKRLEKSVKTFEKACPMFVPLAEEGWGEHASAKTAARDYLEGMKKHGVDTLVLGCTHYPLLKKTIQSVMGKSVTLVDSAETTALAVREVLRERGLANPSKAKGRLSTYVSDDPERFRAMAKRFLGTPLTSVKKKVF